MTPKQLYDYFRQQIGDEAVPYLWGEDEVYRYMDEAHKEFVRRIGGVADSSTEAVVRVEFGPNEAFANLSPLILTVRDAYREEDSRVVDVFNIEDFKYDNLGRNMRREDYYSPWVSWNRNVGPEWRKRTGSPVKAVIVGMERNKLRAWPIPVDSDAVILDVYRLPLLEINKGKNCFFEVDEQHHIHLLDWMYHLAYSKQDVDTHDEQKAAKFEKSFVDYTERVWKENERKRHKPRKVKYGGI